MEGPCYNASQGCKQELQTLFPFVNMAEIQGCVPIKPKNLVHAVVLACNLLEVH